MRRAPSRSGSRSASMTRTGARRIAARPIDAQPGKAPSGPAHPVRAGCESRFGSVIRLLPLSCHATLTVPDGPCPGRVAALRHIAPGRGAGYPGLSQGRSPMFSQDELERYARHIVLHEIGGPGQQRLRDARVLVIGAGGLGSPSILYLAAAGVGTIGIVDHDHVSLSNLQRQVLHGMADIDAPKVGSAAQAVARINPNVRVEEHVQRLEPGNAEALIRSYDLVLD